MFIIVLPQYTNIRSLIGTCALIATLSYYAQNTSIRLFIVSIQVHIILPTWYHSAVNIRSLFGKSNLPTYSVITVNKYQINGRLLHVRPKLVTTNLWLYIWREQLAYVIIQVLERMECVFYFTMELVCLMQTNSCLFLNHFNHGKGLEWS